MLPEITVVKPSVLVTAKSTWLFSVVFCVAELLLALMSVCVAIADAVLVIVPVADEETVVLIVTVAEAPEANVPRVPVKVPEAKFTVPWLDVALTKVKFAGSASVNTTLVAVEGPLLVTVTV